EPVFLVGGKAGDDLDVLTVVDFEAEARGMVGGAHVIEFGTAEEAGVESAGLRDVRDAEGDGGDANDGRALGRARRERAAKDEQNKNARHHARPATIPFA